MKAAGVVPESRVTFSLSPSLVYRSRRSSFVSKRKFGDGMGDEDDEVAGPACCPPLLLALASFSKTEEEEVLYG